MSVHNCLWASVSDKTLYLLDLTCYFRVVALLSGAPLLSEIPRFLENLPLLLGAATLETSTILIKLFI